ncbi:MAG: type II secretion system protein GspM [Methylococcaceae bacterium]
MANLSAQQQRWLAVGLLVLVLVIVIAVIFMPVVNKGIELHETKTALMFRLQQFQRVLARKDAVTTAVAELKENNLEQGYLNSEDTPALASAAVQEFIKRSITDAGGQLNSTQALPVVNKNGFSQISIKVRMTGDTQTLRATLYKIETTSPLIIIDQIDIRPLRGTVNKITHQVDPSNELNVNFEAISFMRLQP